MNCNGHVWEIELLQKQFGEELQDIFETGSWNNALQNKPSLEYVSYNRTSLIGDLSHGSLSTN